VQNRPPATAEVISDASLIVVAGADTTSTVLSHIFYYLMANQDMYRKLQAEVDSVFPPGEDVMDVAKHGKMPYLNGVMCVVLRIPW
jgi:cytochrome P450